MSDLISRRDAMMEARPEYLNPNQKGHEEYNKAWNDGVKAYWNRLKELPSELDWIPCSEGLPKKSTRCLVTWKSMFHTIEIDVAKYGRMFLSERKGLGFYLHGSDVDADITDEVIAWMPLPEPYKGGDTE